MYLTASVALQKEESQREIERQQQQARTSQYIQRITSCYLRSQAGVSMDHLIPFDRTPSKMSTVEKGLRRELVHVKNTLLSYLNREPHRTRLEVTDQGLEVVKKSYEPAESSFNNRVKNLKELTLFFKQLIAKKDQIKLLSRREYGESKVTPTRDLIRQVKKIAIPYLVECGRKLSREQNALIKIQNLADLLVTLKTAHANGDRPQKLAWNPEQGFHVAKRKWRDGEKELQKGIIQAMQMISHYAPILKNRIFSYQILPETWYGRPYREGTLVDFLRDIQGTPNKKGKGKVWNRKAIQEQVRKTNQVFLENGIHPIRI